MKKHDAPLLDVGTFGNKTNKMSEIRDILYGNGKTLKEKKSKLEKDKKKRIDE